MLFFSRILKLPLFIAVAGSVSCSDPPYPPSSVITDMAPGFIAFRKRVNAEKFVKGFGGLVLTYKEALEVWKQQMK